MSIALELHIRAHFYDGRQVKLSSQFAEYYTVHSEINCAILLHIDINFQNCRTHTIICSKTSTFNIFSNSLRACRSCYVLPGRSLTVMGSSTLSNSSFQRTGSKPTSVKVSVYCLLSFRRRFYY